MLGTLRRSYDFNVVFEFCSQEKHDKMSMSIPQTLTFDATFDASWLFVNGTPKAPLLPLKITAFLPCVSVAEDSWYHAVITAHRPSYRQIYFL